jgi:hypothetical protein
MTELPDRVERAFAGHEAYEPADGATFAVTTTPFEAVVAVRVGDDGVVAEVTVWVPTLSAATGDHVADVVEDGWLDTFERRMADAEQALSRGQSVDPTVRVEVEEVVVEGVVEAGAPTPAADDARSLVEYVEGTYMEGVVPGYDYREPVAGLRERARQAGDADGV